MPSTGEEPLVGAILRLTHAGYKDDFRAESEGLRAVVSGCLHEPEFLVIDEIVRFEGVTALDRSS